MPILQARIAVETRNQQERRFAQKTQEGKEAKLRELARQARDQRAGIRTADAGGEEDKVNDYSLPCHVPTDDQEVTKEREQLRYERHKDRERDRRLARAHPDKR